MFHIVLVEPQIPPNTGNVIRLAANTGCTLHLVEPLGFSMHDKLLQRAGLDYHEYVQIKCYASWQIWIQTSTVDPARCFAVTTRGQAGLGSSTWRAGDCFVFGNETAGLSADQLAHFPATQRLRLPMRPGQRSLNLSNAVAVTVFEAWRQQGYLGGA